MFWRIFMMKSKNESLKYWTWPKSDFLQYKTFQALLRLKTIAFFRIIEMLITFFILCFK